MCVCVRNLWLLHFCMLLTCKTCSVAWLRRSPAPSLFQRRRLIAVCVLYSTALSPSFNSANRLPSAGAPQTLTHSVLFILALGVSPRPVSGSVCSKLGVVLLQLCTFRKRCGLCSQVAGVEVESTEHMMRVHATQGAVPLAWLVQWGCCLPHFVYSVLRVDP